RRDDELFVRHRARAVGACELGRAARAGAGLASGGINTVRPGAVLLPPLRRRSLRARAARIRAASAVGAAATRAAAARSTDATAGAGLGRLRGERTPVPPGDPALVDEPHLDAAVGLHLGVQRQAQGPPL